MKNKPKKTAVLAVIGGILLLAAAAITDIVRTGSGNAPLFCISIDNAHYFGAGYGFYIEHPPIYSETDNGSYIFYILGVPVVNRLVN